ncbi:MAG: hypothetical protein DRH12_04615 [Deltaproteobacteria bacterium]|nr:MAG: hypothetical protein DRH12_04615 [Deltaproteobacteria bacterium]
MKKVIAIVAFAALFIGVVAFVYYGQWKEKTAELYYSGTIEATESNLAFQVSGRVARVLVDDGMGVKKGQILAELERKEFVNRLARATAAVEQARSNVKRLRSLLELYKVVLPQQVKQAKAEVEALKAKLNELRSGYRAQQIEQARRVAEAARLRMEDAKRDKIRFERLYREKTASERQRDTAVLRYKTALEEYQKAKEALSLLEEGFRRESITAARAKLSAAQAALEQAKGNLKKIEITQRELEVAEAKLKEAEASEELARLYLEYTELRAPFNGIITSRDVEPGEVVNPAREVISMADLSTVDLKVFVGEPEIGYIKPGQKVKVKTDTFPNKTYKGQVSYISPEAEFTPKIIQTHKERVKLVYLVKVTIPNPDLELKPGMPADAWFR